MTDKYTTEETDTTYGQSRSTVGLGAEDSERLHWLIEWLALNGLLIYHEWATIGSEHGPCWVLRRPAMIAGDSVEGHDPRIAMGAIDSAMKAANLEVRGGQSLKEQIAEMSVIPVSSRR